MPRAQHLLALTLAAGAPWALADDGPVRFVERSAEAGVTFRHVKSGVESKYLIETMGGGVALFDYDGDGRLDIYLVNGAKLVDGQSDDEPPEKVDERYWNRLYRNRGDGRFRDVTREVGLQGRGYGMGAAAGDYDNDGDPDLAVTGYGGVRLYRNDDGRFRDVTAEAGLESRGWTTSAGFFDYDNDGRLDLFVARYLDWDFSRGAKFCGLQQPDGRTYCHPGHFEPISSYLFRNEGDGTFRDVSEAAGIAAHAGKSLGVAFGDYDGDGWTDVFVANDSHPQFLFRNQGDGAFQERALEAGVAYGEDGAVFAGMGVDFADVDGDLRPDVLGTALPHQRYPLFLNDGDGTFADATDRTGLGTITARRGGWGAYVFDYDNDGAADVFLANSHVMDNVEVIEPGMTYEQRPRLLEFRDGRFADVSALSGRVFQTRWAARGAAFGDLDNDGDVDAVVSVLDGPARVLFNQGGKRNRWVALRLEGTRSNRDGLGAVVTLETKDGRRRRKMATRTSSYLASHDPRVFFGLGPNGEIAEAVIEWPSGVVQTVTGLEANRVHEIVEPAADPLGP